MRALKILGGLVALTVLLFLFVVNFSAVESRFECSGKITSNGIETPVKIFLKLETYRWWVGLWSDSSGSAWLEVPNQTVRYFGHITKARDILQLWDSPGKLSGNFSTLSGALGVHLGAFGAFEGTCKDTGR
ncbi:hypothetical protein IRY61_03500 [Candidatus Saccharibacteria bacterium]|nr:hypothetical protein [Candidatus Saccharibacteria bacterium]